MIFVNYKTYEESTGPNAVLLTKALEEAAHETQVKIIPVVQAEDIKEIVSSSTLEVWSQKIDAVSFGAHTGAIIPEAVVDDGARGTFLNHSESRFETFDELAKASDRAKEVGLKTLIFARDLEELKNICSLSPDFLAYEPPELVGSTTTSVAQAEPEVIGKAVEIAKHAGLPLIVGAGIHSEEDVRKSLSLGAVGFAIATNIVKAEDPKAAVLELIKGYQ